MVHTSIAISKGDNAGQSGAAGQTANTKSMRERVTVDGYVGSQVFIHSFIQRMHCYSAAPHGTALYDHVNKSRLYLFLLARVMGKGNGNDRGLEGMECIDLVFGVPA